MVQISLVFALGMLTARPLCCCVAEVPEQPQAERSCCPATQPAAPAGESPCGNGEPCEDCGTISLLAVAERDALSLSPTHTDFIALHRPATVFHRILPAHLNETPRTCWLHFRVDPSPPLLCVFLT